MDIMFLDDAWQDYLYCGATPRYPKVYPLGRRKTQTKALAACDAHRWQKVDKKVLKRINQLIKDIQRSPFEGLGKPEPLKFDMSGLWSRRINQEHRLIYQVKDEYIIVVQCRYHY